MEKGNRNKRWFFLWALPAILAVFFVFIDNSQAEDKKIIINEIYATGNDDWIELYNDTDSDIDLAGNYRLYKSVSSSPSLMMRFGNSSDGNYPGGTIIKPHGYYLIVRDDAAAELLEIADAICTKTSFTWDGSGYTVYFGSDAISNGEDADIIDKVKFVDSQNNTAPEIEDGKSIGRLDGKDTDDNIQDFTLQNPTPGEENKEFENEPEPIPEPEIYSDEIWINELLPNPADGEDEYIELYNNSDEKIELKNWSLHDASKSGEYIFSAEDKIESEEYLAVYRKTFKFALNNGGDEKVTLYDPNGKSVFEITYHGSKKGVSYNFDGEKWHWSSLLTPGTENIFEEIPDGKIKIDKKVFVEVFANFEVVGLSKKAKVTWDFGDGHKSYKPKTKHKYKKTGKYEASVKYSEGSEDVTEKFTIEVEKIKHPEVKIVSVNANPVGSDTKNETITVQNKSKKKINLKGWSIATGWKKLVNHPITEKIEIKAGKKKEITRESSKFTLNNKKAEIELRYPDGKTAYKMKYKKEDKGIAEGEMYVKEKGGWVWVASIQQTADNKQQKTNNIQPKASENQIEGNDQEGAEENEEPEVIEEDVEIVVKKKEVPVLLANNNKYFSKIKISSGEPQVLGAEKIRESNGIYFFTQETTKQEHYAIKFLKNIFAIINTRINFIINFFFQ